MRLPILAAFAALAAAAALVPGAGAYRVEGRAWPDGHIPYYNAAPDQAWAVARAVNAWNTSGARVRFVAVPRASARLVIRSTGSISCDRASATLGYVRSPTIWIWKRDAASRTCDPYWAASALAHEFGHVLGLGHEDRGCAAMNSRGDRRGSAACAPTESWQWRCRLLEHDDVTGAVAVYGGSPRRIGGDPACDVYAPIAAPIYVGGALDAAGGVVRVTLRRPRSPLLPLFLASSAGEEGWTSAWSAGACVSTFDPAAPRYRWKVAAGQTTVVTERVPAPGKHCLSIWALDGLGRPSAAPRKITVGL